jgi:hypothetical protein
MKIIILTIILIGCGSENDEVIDQIVVTESREEIAPEPDTPTMIMCQQAEVCDSEGVCSMAEKPVEFEIDSTLIHFQACYHFRPCDDGKNVFTEEQIENYANQNCGGIE